MHVQHKRQLLSCPFLVHHLTVFIPVIGGVLFVFVIFTLLQTSFTDPGILPRALPDEAADIERQIDNSGSSTYRPPPRTKEILINDQVVKLKYCFTCKMFRPPRTSHCSLCDNCVGLKPVCFNISYSHQQDHKLGAVSSRQYSRAQPDILFKIKGSWSSKRGEESGNPYTYNNIFSNCCVVLCAPMPPSLIDRRGFLPPDDAPQTVTSDTELPPFMAKNDTNMCTQSTKELLESMAHSTVIQSTCAPGTPKTAPVTQESLLSTISSTVSPPNRPPSTGCSGRQARRPIDVPCSQRENKRAALHNHKPMLHVPSPPYSVGHSPLILSDAPDMGFIPLN
ncbi:palmitoyltransferase ZDHHC18 isoform X1 [Labeo rohita]|uniref:Palmitoyltransferase ZDHHC18 isoform X1 n=1 Tax=Labeo rohita TaxID=84645 RepID=A0A498LE79_LABRO|nr:palmitoyltransferase ZDHHC18 isoform X1 [Labeo rohita]